MESGFERMQPGAAAVHSPGECSRAARDPVPRPDPIIRIDEQRPRRSYREASDQDRSLPEDPRRIPHARPRGPRPLRRQGPRPAQPRFQLFPRFGRPARVARAGNRPHGRPRHRRRFSRLRDGGRRAAHREPPHQGHSAAIQRAAEGRQELPLPRNHHRRRLPRRLRDAQAAHPRREALRPVYQRRPASRGRQRLAARLQIPHLRAGNPRRRRQAALLSAVPAARDTSMHGPLRRLDRKGEIRRGHRAPAQAADQQAQHAATPDAAGNGGGGPVAALRRRRRPARPAARNSVALALRRRG